MFTFPQGSPRSDLQTPVPSTVISTSSSAATTPETERKPLAPLPPVVNLRKDSQLRRPIPVRPPSVDNIPYQNNHSAVGKFILLRGDTYFEKRFKTTNSTTIVLLCNLYKNTYYIIIIIVLDEKM